MRSRSNSAVSFSSGPSRPPTSPPRCSRSVTSLMRAASSSQVRWAPGPGSVGLEGDLVAQPLQGRAQLLDPRGVLVGRGVEGEPLAQLAGERVAEPARLGQRDRERPRRRPGDRRAPGEDGGVEGRVEAAVDQRRQAFALGLQHATATPDGEQQLEPVRDGLPERHRQRHVAGQLVLARRRQRGGVQLVELVLAEAHPGVQLGEVRLHGHHLDRLPQPPGRVRRVHRTHRAPRYVELRLGRRVAPRDRRVAPRDGRLVTGRNDVTDATRHTRHATQRITGRN